MSRPQKCRTICIPPKMKGFRPYGLPPCKDSSVILSFEGYESIKLIDYEMLSQGEAAERMNISRPTFTRTYNKALKIIAKAFVEGRAIEIEGGSYQIEDEWYRCNKCYRLIHGAGNHVKCKKCSSFGMNELTIINLPGERS